MSRDFSFGFDVVVRDLRDISEELSRTVADRIREAGSGLRSTATEAARAEEQAAARISGIDVDTGQRVSVDRRTVLSVPLMDDNDRVIGVFYPREPREIMRMTYWASSTDRTTDREFYLLRPTMEEGAFGPTTKFDDPRPAAWTDPIFVQAHGPNRAVDGNDNMFNVLAGSGTAADPAWRILRVSDTEFGPTLGSDSVLLRAAAEARSDDLLIMSCNAASGSAVRTISGYLRDSVGSTLTVHGFTGKTVERMHAGGGDGGSTSWFGVHEVLDASGTPIDPVNSYPPG
ncbi:hypothetical protein [Nocardia sp. alder85J]|uniref:hypothetical protein n=1 Tax=Nocardia sp. alder85J TaxID=2862949 RepID=UPI001CD1B298|nr:hypothetical protein [Nocardia sp. alder85J]MCX4096836.1 hypothetical protein [Nocardia sp. alder85J]